MRILQSPSLDRELEQFCPLNDLNSDSTGDNQEVKHEKGIFVALMHAWRLEIGAMIVCLIFTIAIIAVLAIGDGQPVDQWHSSLSFNTIISMLAVGARTSLTMLVVSCLSQQKWNWFRRRVDSLETFQRFEDASRSPLGSLSLALWLGFRHWTTLGALALILLLAFQPLFQVVVPYDGRLDSLDNSYPPVVSKSDFLDAGSMVLQHSQPQSDSDAKNASQHFVFQPDMGLVAAAYGGFSQFGQQNAHKPSLTCSTGNCTWPLFTSLGVCGKCNDVTSHLKKRSFRGKISQGSVQVFIVNVTEYSLPYVNPNVVNLTNTAAKKSTDNHFLKKYMSAGAFTNPRDTLSFKDDSTMVVAVGMIRADKSYEQNMTTWGETPVSATECALYLCVNAYNTSIQHGVLNEAVIASWATRGWGSFQPVRTVQKEEDEAYRTDLELVIPSIEAASLELSKTSKLNFTITQRAVQSMMVFLADGFFTRQITWPDTNQSLVAPSLYSSTDLRQTFSKAASSISSWMRQHSNNQEIGLEYAWIVRIRVRWLHLALPLLVVIGGCVFGILCMWETHTMGMQPWGTNVIATLTHSLDAEASACLRVADRRGHSNETVKALAVGLRDSGVGLELHIAREHDGSARRY